jgi:hypothetical protein
MCSAIFYSLELVDVLQQIYYTDTKHLELATNNDVIILCSGGFNLRTHCFAVVLKPV